MRKGFLAPKAKVPQDSYGDTASSSKTNQGLIKNILEAVSDVGRVAGEAEKRIEDMEFETEKRKPFSTTRGSEVTGDAVGDEGNTGKGKLVKMISEGVLSQEDQLPEQLETPTDVTPSMEEGTPVQMVEDKVC